MRWKKYKKYLLYIGLIVIIPILLEAFVYNRSSLGSQSTIFYQRGEGRSEEIKRVKKTENGIRIRLKEPVYIKKLQIWMEASKECEFQILIEYESSFGTELEETIKDYYWPELGTAYTNIDKKVSALQIIVDKYIVSDINGVQLTNQFSWNSYRLLFWGMLVFLACLVFDRRAWIVRKPEWMTAIVCLVMGSFIIYTQGVNENGWDEQVHFQNAYQLSWRGSEFETDNTYQLLSQRLSTLYYNTTEEKELLTQYINQQYTVNRQTTPKTVAFSYNKVAYMVQAAAVWVGRHLGLSFNRFYMLGKWANLWTYILLIFVSIRLVPKWKYIFGGIALIPTQVFIASTYTYDVISQGLLLLGMALWLKVLLEEKNRYTAIYILGCIAAFGIGALAKAVYIPLILLCCAIPKDKFISDKIYKAFWAVVISGCIVIMLTFVAPILQNVLSNNVGWGGDPRGGETDAVVQFQSVLSHPLEYVLMLLRNIGESMADYLIGTEGILSFGRMTERYPMDGIFYYLGILWMAAILFFEKPEKIGLSGKYRCILLGVAAFILFFIWTAMYLSYTPVGKEEIVGVQARYYYPLIMGAALIFENKKVYVQLSGDRYAQVVFVVPVALLLAGIYYTMLKPYLW